MGSVLANLATILIFINLIVKESTIFLSTCGSLPSCKNSENLNGQIKGSFLHPNCNKNWALILFTVHCKETLCQISGKTDERFLEKAIDRHVSGQAYLIGT